MEDDAMRRTAACLIAAVTMQSLIPAASAAVTDTSAESLRLSESVPPEVACWFWGGADFAPGGYKEKLDLFGQHTSFTLLTASFRAGRREPLTDPAVFEQVKQAVAYAKTKDRHRAGVQHVERFDRVSPGVSR